MPIVDFGRIDSGASLAELIEEIAKMQKYLDFLLQGGLDSKNAREFGGYQVGPDYFRSKNGQVGLSSANTPGDDIRLWAGDSITGVPPFRVYESGKMVASNAEITGKITATSGTIGGWNIGPSELSGPGTITGGTIRTGAAGTARLELQTGGFRGVTSDGLLSGLVFNPTTTNIVDLFLYHRGTKLLEFFDNITGFIIRGVASSTGMTLGGTAAPTFAAGSWSFNTGSSLDLTSATVSGLTFSYSGVTSPGGSDNHTHAFSVSGNVT